MKFRDDIDPENTWVTSDTHFGHENIVGFCHRPEDHEQAMIAEWRRVVPDDGTVLHLGDLCYRGNGRFKNITAKELTGARKLLILGNHDRQRYSFYKQSGFQICRPFSLRFRLTDPETLKQVYSGDGAWSYTVSFSHYPWGKDDWVRTVDKDGKEHILKKEMAPTDLRLHGHIHNNGYTRDGFVPFLKQHVNLSVEQTRYTPVNLKLLLDAVLLGKYPETTQEQLDEARERKERNNAA